MCVALTGRVVELNGKNAVVDFHGNRIVARAGLVAIEVGDDVLVHAGCIIQKILPQDMEELEELDTFTNKSFHLL